MRRKLERRMRRNFRVYTPKHSPDFLEMSRREFDEASHRILTKVNPKRELIRNPLELEKKMIKIMSETDNYRLLGALKRGYAQRAFMRLAEGDKFHRIWLGWEQPKLPRGKMRIIRFRERKSRRF